MAARPAIGRRSRPRDSAGRRQRSGPMRAQLWKQAKLNLSYTRYVWLTRIVNAMVGAFDASDRSATTGRHGRTLMDRGAGLETKYISEKRNISNSHLLNGPQGQPNHPIWKPMDV